MKTELKKLSDSRVAITVKLDAKDLKDAAGKALEKLSKEIRVDFLRLLVVAANRQKRLFEPAQRLVAEPQVRRAHVVHHIPGYHQRVAVSPMLKQPTSDFYGRFGRLGGLAGVEGEHGVIAQQTGEGLNGAVAHHEYLRIRIQSLA